MPEEAIILDTQFDPEDEYRPEPEPEPVPAAWLDGSLRIGIHTSIAGSSLNALESARQRAFPMRMRPRFVRVARVGAGAAGGSRELFDQSGSHSADAAYAFDPGI